MKDKCICYNDPYFMINDSTISVETEKMPFCGQSHRSSEDFQVDLATTYTITAPAGVKFTIWADWRPAALDTLVFEYPAQGTSVYLETNANLQNRGYYIGDPQGFTNTAVIKFTPVTYRD